MLNASGERDGCEFLFIHPNGRKQYPASRFGTVAFRTMKNNVEQLLSLVIRENLLLLPRGYSYVQMINSLGSHDAPKDDNFENFDSCITLEEKIVQLILLFSCTKTVTTMTLRKSRIRIKRFNSVS